MREIKFKRAYFANEDKTGFLGFKMWGVNLDESVFTAPTNKSNSMSFIDYQYTGIKAKYNKEVYEGHIVKFRHSGAHSDTLGIVVFNESCFRAKSLNDNNLHYGLWCKLEIIGNIHEDPKLLKS